MTSLDDVIATLHGNCGYFSITKCHFLYLEFSAQMCAALCHCVTAIHAQQPKAIIGILYIVCMTLQEASGNCTKLAEFPYYMPKLSIVRSWHKLPMHKRGGEGLSHRTSARSD